MRAFDWLVAFLAIAAIGIGLAVNLQMCQITSGGGFPSGPHRCIPIFPGPAVVGLAVAAVATIALTIMTLRRPRPKDA